MIRRDYTASSDHIESIIYAMEDYLLRFGRGDEIPAGTRASGGFESRGRSNRCAKSSPCPMEKAHLREGKTTLAQLNGLRQELDMLLAEIGAWPAASARTLQGKGPAYGDFVMSAGATPRLPCQRGPPVLRRDFPN